MGDAQPDHGNGTRVGLRMLGGFDLVVESHHPVLPLSAQRLLVALALRPPEQDRTVLVSMLYPGARRDNAAASLRSALWRVRRQVGPVVVRSGQRLRLADAVEVDLRQVTSRARSALSRPAAEADTDLVDALSRQLLPTWGEEWLMIDQQRWDQVRLHTLERLAELFAGGGRHVDALEAGLAAVSIEPYRESAHRALISAFIAEGNSASAVAQYHRYQRLVRRELGLRPTPELQALVRGLTSD